MLDFMKAQNHTAPKNCCMQTHVREREEQCYRRWNSHIYGRDVAIESNKNIFIE